MEAIKKSYEYRIPRPVDFFESFHKKYSVCRFPSSWNANTAWTETIFRLFGEMGRDFAYRPRREYLDIDMTWSVRLDDISLITVAIEHDNGDLGDVIDDELQKLMDVKARLKVLMFYPGKPLVLEDKIQFPEVVDKIRSAHIKSPDERYLLITPVIQKADKTHAKGIEVFACAFSPDGDWGNLKSFSVPYNGKI
jgi:hypothetical protein